MNAESMTGRAGNLHTGTASRGTERGRGKTGQADNFAGSGLLEGLSFREGAGKESTRVESPAQSGEAEWKKPWQAESIPARQREALTLPCSPGRGLG